MKQVIIASENPVKIAVAKRAFSAVYPNEEFTFLAIKSESGVPSQPMNTETKEGAFNRLNFARNAYPDADFWISQEGGLFEDDVRMYNRAWIVVCDLYGRIAESSTACFYLPPKIVSYIREGMELGHANDVFFGSSNSKQGKGAIGYLTDGLIHREDYYVQSAIIALSELKHADWYSHE